ncbi:hypothetical protein AKJ09_09798 [Labilithrix luteola]|uniref:Uncharacterized protein n=1 Tax=Labilithrix luteola TaxID=1391654 RepID=A0A0K1QCH7_9BACT|nr:hypothetical protein [Labilithrix luteola]AKV03135.1 hypothetical protein AKJ09_09798 [Labilithrix luteola]
MLLLDVAEAHLDSVVVAIDIDVSASKACSLEAFREAVLGASSRTVQVRNDAQAHVGLTVDAVGERLRGEARFEGASGADERTLVAASCDELRDAFGLVAGTWLDAEPASSAEKSSSPASSGVAVPERTNDANVAPIKTRPTRGPLAIGAHGLVFTGVGAAAVGGGVTLAFSTETLELRGAARFASSADSAADVGHASYRWYTLAFDGCLGRPRGEPFSFTGCGRLSPGVFLPTVEGDARALAWLTAGLGPRVGWSVGPVVLEAELFLDVAVLGYRLTPTASNLVAFRAILPSAAVGLSFPLP